MDVTDGERMPRITAPGPGQVFGRGGFVKIPSGEGVAAVGARHASSVPAGCDIQEVHFINIPG
jgi:hypothetical protein